MAGAKPWQLVVIAVSLVIATIALVYFVASGDPLRPVTHAYFIDVETGKVYYADIRKSVIIPARRPDGNKERALIRLAQDETGKFFVNGRDRDALSSIDTGVTNKFVDPVTGALVEPFTGRGAITYREP